MPTRRIVFAPDEYYHLYNRGTQKTNIFLDDRDRIRFLFLVLYFQLQETPQNISRQVSYFVKHRMFNIEVSVKKRLVDLVAFSLMPNHFHLLVKEAEEGGISKYLQKLLNAYTKYFNTKYEKSGHLFQGPFKAVHIKDNDQLLYASAYVHRNPREIKEWKNRDHLYPWSSFQDYSEDNRWDKLLVCNSILEQFTSRNEYKNWVISSAAKGEYELVQL